MHIDNVTVNADGSMTIALVEFLNPAVAASFVGAASAVTVANPNPQELDIQLTLTPSAPVTESTAQSDPGGSASIDG